VLYTVFVALLFGADKWIYEAQQAGVLKLSETGVFVVWLITFLVAQFTRVVTPSVSKPKSKAIEINSPSDIKL
jgi:hypothetical protein